MLQMVKMQYTSSLNFVCVTAFFIYIRKLFIASCFKWTRKRKVISVVSHLLFEHKSVSWYSNIIWIDPVYLFCYLREIGSHTAHCTSLSFISIYKKTPPHNPKITWAVSQQQRLIHVMVIIWSGDLYRESYGRAAAQNNPGQRLHANNMSIEKPSWRESTFSKSFHQSSRHYNIPSKGSWATAKVQQWKKLPLIGAGTEVATRRYTLLCLKFQIWWRPEMHCSLTFTF